ncbi:hypothetical protein Ahy_B01g053756 [Arachis hypogaea]|uniref:Uncharacterized protein n=1 Tax=Arachis hypogaea TaxID=3818 RepID=A0A445ASD8_ARAHY|nr:hypothetical protein Ahy_B01g053756 [Arachis hypogaea]
MEESDFLVGCGSIKFAKEMGSVSRFSLLQHALNVASDLIPLNAHTNIFDKVPFSHASYNSASSTIMNSSIKVGYEIYAPNLQYLKRFDFSYFMKASDWNANIVLTDMKIIIGKNLFTKHYI